MTISRRSFLKGLAALPLVAAFLPKEVPTETVEYFSTDGKRIFNRIKVEKFGTESSHCDGKDYIYIGSKEPLPSMRWDCSDDRTTEVSSWDEDKKRWIPVIFTNGNSLGKSTNY